MPKASRYRLLALFEERFKTFFYQPLLHCFSDPATLVHEAEHLVPCASQLTKLEQDEEGDAYFSIRHGGSVYIAKTQLSVEQSGLSYVKCLGRDYLPYFLYEIEINGERLVFAKHECVGRFDVSADSLLIDTSSVKCQIEDDIWADVVLHSPLFLSSRAATSYLLKDIKQLLVVKQADQYFALPFNAVREVEAVCSAMPEPRAWVKNIWLSQSNQVLLEPWLLSNKTGLELRAWKERKKSTPSAKNGYYFGRYYGRMFWIEATLVSELLPYQASLLVTHYDGDAYQARRYFVYDGRSFDQVLPEAHVFDGKVQKAMFSLILECLGEAIVLPLASCDWVAELPKENAFVDVFSGVESVLEQDGSPWQCFATLREGDLVICKKNYLSFVAGLWPATSLACK